MRPRSLARLLVLCLPVLLLLPSAPAQAASGWTLTYVFPHTDVQSVMQGTIAGRPGNWHSAWLDLDGSDDWVSGALADWSCPTGATPPSIPWTPSPCTALSITDFDRFTSSVAPVTPGTTRISLAGTAFEEGSAGVRVDLRWVAAGPVTTRYTELGSYPDVDDPSVLVRTKEVALARGDVTAKGRIGWYRLSDATTTTARDFDVIRTYEKRVPA